MRAMTQASPTTQPKRFYKSATVSETDQGWGIDLDERSVKTPARAGLVLPSKALAEAIAGEWNAQGERIDIASMHLMRLANVAIDRVPETRSELADELARYCETDLTCHLAVEPEELVLREAAAWTPVRDWADQALGVSLVAVEGIVASPQPDASLEAARTHALALDDFRLIGLLFACGLYGSAVLAMAVEQGMVTAQDALIRARVDEIYQTQEWGEDDEAKARVALLEEQVKALDAWFATLEV